MKIFTLDDFRQRSLNSNKDVYEKISGDFNFNPELEDHIRKNALREAAVLIGILSGPHASPQVLLTIRTKELRAHSGQIAFPGGRADKDDRSFEMTALRETYEETGIGSEYVDVVGRLPVYFSGSGYRIHPILAVIKEGYRLKPNVDEVDDIFDVPLSFLMNENNHKISSLTWQGKKHQFYEMSYGNYRIWGVTAGILRVMYERLYR